MLDLSGDLRFTTYDLQFAVAKNSKLAVMKIFVDTGDVAEVKQAAEWGILDGVTTNPSLIAKSGKGFKETVLKICDLVPGGDISAEIVATDYDTMLKEALEIHSWNPQNVVK